MDAVCTILRTSKERKLLDRALLETFCKIWLAQKQEFPVFFPLTILILLYLGKEEIVLLEFGKTIFVSLNGFGMMASRRFKSLVVFGMLFPEQCPLQGATKNLFYNFNDTTYSLSSRVPTDYISHFASSSSIEMNISSLPDKKTVRQFITLYPLKCRFLYLSQLAYFFRCMRCPLVIRKPENAFPSWMVSFLYYCNGSVTVFSTLRQMTVFKWRSFRKICICLTILSFI